MRQPVARRISEIYFEYTQQMRLDNSENLNLEECLKQKRTPCLSQTDHYQACFFAGNIPPCLMDIKNPTSFSKKTLSQI